MGGVFNAVNQGVYEARANPVPMKARYYQKDMQDWARFQGIKIGNPPIFPINSVKAMRGCFVAIELGRISKYAGLVFEAYWSDLKDISNDKVLKEIVEASDMNAGDFFRKIVSDEYKQKLRRNTDELIERGGFGSPTIYINGDDMYFGNDRLVLVEQRLRGN